MADCSPSFCFDDRFVCLWSWLKERLSRSNPTSNRKNSKGSDAPTDPAGPRFPFLSLLLTTPFNSLRVHCGGTSVLLALVLSPRLAKPLEDNTKRYWGALSLIANLSPLLNLPSGTVAQ
ncbi:hypothetical protein GGG16DRAFT_115233 [Schizophyllum commune]